MRKRLFLSLIYFFTILQVACSSPAASSEIKEISINGEPLENFVVTTSDYLVYLPYSVESSPGIQVTFSSSEQSGYTVRNAKNIKGTGEDRKAQIILSDGKVYNLYFEVLPKLDLYLLIGQSNMAGRGYLTKDYENVIENTYLLTPASSMEPAQAPLNKYSTIRKEMKLQGVNPGYSFAQEITHKTGRSIGLIVNARGGSSINSWLKGAPDDYFGEALKRARSAMKWGEIKAILWHQGESDSRFPDAYLPKLTALVNDLRQELNNKDLFFVVGELAAWRKGRTSDAFNRVLRTVPVDIPHTACVSSEGLTPLIDENDPHFSAESQVTLGKRYAEVVYKACYDN